MEPRAVCEATVLNRGRRSLGLRITTGSGPAWFIAGVTGAGLGGGCPGRGSTRIGVEAASWPTPTSVSMRITARATSRSRVSVAAACLWAAMMARPRPNHKTSSRSCRRSIRARAPSGCSTAPHGASPAQPGDRHRRPGAHPLHLVTPHAALPAASVPPLRAAWLSGPSRGPHDGLSYSRR